MIITRAVTNNKKKDGKNKDNFNELRDYWKPKDKETAVRVIILHTEKTEQKNIIWKVPIIMTATIKTEKAKRYAGRPR